MKRLLLVVGLMLVMSAAVQAQTPVAVTSASGIEFNASTDHTATMADGTQILARYEMRFTATAPSATCTAVPTVNLAKPTPASGVIAVRPLPAFGTLPGNCIYTSTIAAVGPTGLEGVSAVSAPFVRDVFRAPAAPSAAPRIVP